MRRAWIRSFLFGVSASLFQGEAKKSYSQDLLRSSARSVEAVVDVLNDPRLLLVPLPSLPRFTNLTRILPPSDSNGPRTSYLIHTTENFRVAIPNSDDYYNKSAVQRLRRTSVQAKMNNCFLAANGGPFNLDGTCVGGVVSDGKVVTTDFNGGVGFGLLQNDSWVLGSIDSIQQAQDLQLEQFVTGFDWLVRDGVNVAGTNSFRAPRTAIGLNAQGILMLLVSDGCEYCLRRKGATLYELADILVAYGAVHAINLDGGGSSTLVARTAHRVVVLNQPNCLDIPVACQRPVASVVCFEYQRNSSASRHLGETTANDEAAVLELFS